MNAAELEALEERVCTRKEKLTAKRARNRAASLNAEGEEVRPYRCPFCPCWHIGHVMSWVGVEQLAEAIRFRSYPEGGHVDRRAS